MHELRSALDETKVGGQFEECLDPFELAARLGDEVFEAYIEILLGSDVSHRPKAAQERITPEPARGPQRWRRLDNVADRRVFLDIGE